MKERQREYRPFSEWTWKNYDGDKNVSVDEFISNHMEDFLIIGTDSQNYSKKRICVFTSVLIAYKLYKGGSVILHRDRVPYIDSIRHRLLLEAMRSLEVAWHVDSRVSDKNIIEVHLDINANLKYRSAQYKSELVGLIASQGFACVIKPHAFAASGIADRKC